VLTDGREGDDRDAAAAAGVDAVVGLGDVRQLVAVADLDGQGARGGCGGEIPRCLAFGFGCGLT
jgi:hypothetical protein